MLWLCNRQKKLPLSVFLIIVYEHNGDTTNIRPTSILKIKHNFHKNF